jgi:hypothetical protein
VISEHTRTCPTCRTILPETSPSVCPNSDCSRVVCPPIDAWPRHLRRWLVQRKLADFFAPWRHLTPQRRWERLLVSVMAGRAWGGRSFRMAIDPADAYPAALSEAENWEAEGCRTLYE